MNKKEYITSKDIKPLNNKNQWHGYQQWSILAKLWLRGVYKNDEPIGYIEEHTAKETTYYIR